MDPYDGAVDHLDLPIMCLRHGIHQAVPDAGFPPAIEAIVSRRVGTITLGQVPPWSAGSQHPEDAVHYPTIVLPLRSRSPAR